MRPVLLAALMASCAAAQPVRIGVLGLFHPVRLHLRPAAGAALVVEAGAVRFVLTDGQSATLVARAGNVEIESDAGAAVADEVRVAPRGNAGLILTVAGKLERLYRGSLRATVVEDALEPVVTMDLEDAVAGAVAAESRPGSPLGALKAQAVAARSYYTAAGRHSRFNFCDSTHCQFLRDTPAAAAPAARAAVETRGLVLLWHGRPIAALYSAGCGGRTRALAGSAPGDDYPYFAVDCAPCLRGAHASCSYCTREGGAWPNRRGNGSGHGAGLCQTGAFVMAASGAGFQEILHHYFPNAEIAARPRLSMARDGD